MKKLIFDIKDDLRNLAFPSGRLESRKDILLVVLESCRYMMYNEPIKNATEKFILVVNEMNRIVFCQKKKMYSVVFPFHADISDTGIRFDYNKIEIDSQTLSNICQVLESEDFNAMDSLDFIAPIESIRENNNPFFWIVLKHLLTYEIGYIRYDDDMEGYQKACKNKNPKQHPRYHYDVNYTSSGTYKVGLEKQLTPAKFVDFLDNTKDRWMAKP